MDYIYVPDNEDDDSSQKGIELESSLVEEAIELSEKLGMTLSEYLDIAIAEHNLKMEQILMATEATVFRLLDIEDDED